MSLRRSCIVVALAATITASHAAEQAMWTMLTNSLGNREGGEDFSTIRVNWGAAVQVFRSADLGPVPQGRRLAQEPQEVATQVVLDLPRGPTKCELRPSSVLAPELKAKFPNIKAVTGGCEDGSQVSLMCDVTREGSMQGNIETPNGKQLLIDVQFGADTGPVPQGRRLEQASKDIYMVYDRKSSVFSASFKLPPVCQSGDFSNIPPQGRRLEEHDHAHVSLQEPLVPKRLRPIRRLDTEAGKTRMAFKLRIAISTTYGYTDHFNGKEGALLSITALLQRLNGIYSREVGIIFELVKDNDKLICDRASPSAPCAAMIESSYTVNPNHAAFIKNMSISTDEYDVGHVLFKSNDRFGSGRADVSSLCGEKKAQGSSGKPNPNNDPFWVDFVSHELGHQLGAMHVMQDCNGGEYANGAVEPGSGSTIMGYAGICGERDLQLNSDPYFNTMNLAEIHSLVSQKTSDASCGKRYALKADLPIAEVSQQSCVVPLGNAFQLKGNSMNATYHSWEWYDPGLRKYLEDQGRFRSWKPRESRSRFFPNLSYILRGNAKDIKDERLPTSPSEMNFRFTARQVYATYESENLPADLNHTGAFATADVKVEFRNVGSPLRWKPLATDTQLEPNKYHSLSWEASTSSFAPRVRIFVARNVLPADVGDRIGSSSSPQFDSDKDIVDFEWIDLGNFANSGTADVYIPAIDRYLARQVVIMVRSPEDACFFFDVQTVTLKAGDTTIPIPPLSTAPPTAPPTPSSTFPIYVGVGVGSTLFAVLSFSALFVRLKRRGGRASDSFPQSAVPRKSIGERYGAMVGNPLFDSDNN